MKVLEPVNRFNIPLMTATSDREAYMHIMSDRYHNLPVFTLLIGLIQEIFD
jgi:hypothetical protein